MSERDAVFAVILVTSSRFNHAWRIQEEPWVHCITPATGWCEYRPGTCPSPDRRIEQLHAEIAKEFPNRHNSSALVACLADDAVIYDDGDEIRGKVAIKEWSDRNNREYNTAVNVTNIAHQNNEVIVTAPVTGTFEGSPLQFQYHFTISGNKIAGLSVRE